LDVLKPEYVSPLVLFLCHENTDETGSLFEVGGGWVGKLRWQKSSGALFDRTKAMSPEDGKILSFCDTLNFFYQMINLKILVREKWNDITSFENPLYHTAIGESTNFCINGPESESSVNDLSPSTRSKKSDNEPFKFNYDFKESILYNLSLGISSSNEKNLKFLYENHPEFSVLPTFGVIPAYAVLFNAISEFKLPYNLQIDPSKVLHGEHYLEVFKPISTSGTLDSKVELVDVLDKGSGAVLVINVELLNEKREKVALNQFVTFFVGSGNFGGPRDSSKLVKTNTKKFDRKPDTTIDEKTSLDQAALYRLNGDLNPLHIDPSFSQILGFDRPILHGLCSFGYAVKHIIQAYCNNHVSLFKSVKVRFAKPVFPGQTIQTNMWFEKESNRVYFECKVIETQTVVLSGGYADLNGSAQAQTVCENSSPLKTVILICLLLF
jgi:3-hydroxyacyl-CoA dehydrogenase/3a,7a,12a-trihydroxy-5b-cholest-24-enoyl-CoA hydratase